MTTGPIDFADLNLRAGSDHLLAREVLRDLIEVVERDRPILREACRARSFADTARMTHRLRGSLLAVGAGWAARRALRLEEVALQSSESDIDHAYRRFESALDDALVAIQSFLAEP